MSVEIERKFLPEHLPLLIQPLRQTKIRQGYLSAGNGRETRIRNREGKCSLTTKCGSGMERGEWETSLTEEQFNALWPATRGFRVEKKRYEYEWNGLTLEIDRYREELGGLITAEIEFSGQKEAADFLPPAFLGEEITFDPRYKNRSLATMSSGELPRLLPSGMNSGVIGTIPYLWEKGELKVVIITKRHSPKWIFPKGQQENGLEHSAVALLEAEEEAGITGTLTHNPLRVPYIKGENTTNMKAFPIQVKKLRKHWEEEKLRERKIVSLQEARKLSDQTAVHCGLEFLEQMVL